MRSSRVTTFVRFILPAALLWGGPLGFGQKVAGTPAPDPSQHWLDAYLGYKEAQKAERDGNTEQAAKLYSKALVEFAAVKTRFPEWNPELVAHRLRQCRQKLAAIEKLLDEKKLDRKGLVVLVKTLRDRRSQLEAENAKLAKGLSAAHEALAQSQAETQAANAAKDEAATAATAARKPLAELTAKHDDATRKLQEALAKEEEAAVARKQLETKIAENEKALSSSQRGLQAAEKQAAKLAAKASKADDMEVELHDLRAKRGAFDEQVETIGKLRGQLEQFLPMKKELELMTKEADSLRLQLEASQKANGKLRKQLLTIRNLISPGAPATGSVKQQK